MTDFALAGHVSLVGAGPGDPDLLTVKGHRYLTQAEVIVYDRLVNNVLLELAPKHCELIYAGKRKNLHAMSQEQINEVLIDQAQQGKRVVRLKGGDPFMFGRGGEEIAALQHAGISCDVVPGITAATGAAASLALPLTLRGRAQAVTFVTAHKQAGVLDVDWDLVLRPNQTIAFYMGFSVLTELVEGLLERGAPADTKFSVVANATQENEMVVHSTLRDIRKRVELTTMRTPVILIMHNLPIAEVAMVAADARRQANLSA